MFAANLDEKCHMLQDRTMYFARHLSKQDKEFLRVEPSLTKVKIS